MSENSNLININTQNKLIIFGTLISSVLIIITAWFVINNTQKTILQSYYNFGLMMGKSLAVEGSAIFKEPLQDVKQAKLKFHSDFIVKNNPDIAYVVFSDKKGNIIYSNKNSFYEDSAKFINISNPVFGDNKKVLGQVNIGLTGKSMKEVGKATRNLMLLIFSAAWILSVIAVLINTLLMTRQIKLLSEGVNKISSGEFGYKLTSKDLWGEVKALFESFNNMSVRLRKYEEKNIDQLTYEKNKLEAVLMSIANGVIVCDKHDQIILVNNAANKILKVVTGQILNTKISEFCDADGKVCFREKIKEFKNTPLEDIESKPFRFQADVDKNILQTIVSPIFTINRDYLGYILVLRDITKEKEIDKLKDTFISNVSHELRTPVTVLRSYIETLHNYGNEFDEKTKAEFIEIMDKEAERLNRMVNDILDFSRLESPDVEIEKTLCDIRPVIELTVTSLRVLFEEKNLSVSMLIEHDLPEVLINPDSIERVLRNLFSNAIKYSKEGGRIKVKAEIDRTGNWLEVSIEDNGEGIPAKHLPKIFDRFYRVENESHEVKGTGLGLHIVKTAIEKHHNGRVFVESEVNKGSTFGFRIPLKTADKEASKV